MRAPIGAVPAQDEKWLAIINIINNTYNSNNSNTLSSLALYMIYPSTRRRSPHSSLLVVRGSPALRRLILTNLSKRMFYVVNSRLCLWFVILGFLASSKSKIKKVDSSIFINDVNSSWARATRSGRVPVVRCCWRDARLVRCTLCENVSAGVRLYCIPRGHQWNFSNTLGLEQAEGSYNS